MNKFYQVKVIKINENFEEKTILQFKEGGGILTCFAGACPYQIEEGKIYPVELSMFVVETP
jgi:hypothetical protein